VLPDRLVCGDTELSVTDRQTDRQTFNTVRSRLLFVRRYQQTADRQQQQTAECSDSVQLLHWPQHTAGWDMAALYILSGRSCRVTSTVTLFVIFLHSSKKV